MGVDDQLQDEQDYCTCFGKKLKKTVGTAVVVNLVGVALFISGIMLILYQGKSKPEVNPDITSFKIGPPQKSPNSSVYARDFKK